MSADGNRGTALGSCPTPLASAYDAALFDLDGVLYVGTEPVQHASQVVRQARALGMRAAFVTNNASRRPGAVAAHLVELGIPASPEDVVTSAQAAVRLLREKLPAGAMVLVVGAAGLAEEVSAGGFEPVWEASGEVAAVVQGYSRDTGWAQLAEATVALRAGALWVATNTDNTLPSPRGPLPGNGAMVAALRTASGLEPVVAGKPQPTLHLESVARVGSQRPLVVGDRLDTDVLGAVRGGADSLLVLTGVVDALAALAAPAGMRPTYVSYDLRGLLAAQTAVDFDAFGSRCGAARAEVVDDRIIVSGAGDDGLRAACALAWRSADVGQPIRAAVGLQRA